MALPRIVTIPFGIEIDLILDFDFRLVLLELCDRR